jgi:hypothetical protein
MRWWCRGRALIAWYGIHTAFTENFTPHTGFRVDRVVGCGEAEMLKVDTAVDAAVEEPGTDVVAPKPPNPRTLPFYETIDWFVHITSHLLLLLPTPASNRFAHLTWSIVALVAKRCASVLTTPQSPSTDVPASKIPFHLALSLPVGPTRNERIFLRGQ